MGVIMRNLAIVRNNISVLFVRWYSGRRTRDQWFQKFSKVSVFQNGIKPGKGGPLLAYRAYRMLLSAAVALH